MLHNHYHYFQNVFITPGTNSVPIKQYFHIPFSTQPRVISILLSVSMTLPVLGMSYKWNHTFVLLCLAYFAQHVFPVHTQYSMSRHKQMKPPVPIILQALLKLWMVPLCHLSQLQLFTCYFCFALHEAEIGHHTPTNCFPTLHRLG